MKKLMLLFGLIAFVSFSFVSCSGDDDNGPQDNPNSNLYGTWKTKYSVMNGTHIDPSTCADIKEYNFLSNGTYTLQTFTGDNLQDCQDDITISGVWSYKGNDNYLIHRRNVNITNENEAQYTFYLEFPENDEMKWKTSENTSDYVLYEK